MGPDYKDRDPRGWCGDPTRGAAMGRHSYHGHGADYSGRILVSAVRMHGDYDANGTYWGFVRGTAIYWYRSPDGEIDACVRATSRIDARRKVLAIFPAAKIRRLACKYEVHSGHPSWHQARAGHISAGAMVFGTRKAANAYLARCKALRPDEPAFIVVKEVR